MFLNAQANIVLPVYKLRHKYETLYSDNIIIVLKI